jgi:ferredoxin--NADP+ reductase
VAFTSSELRELGQIPGVELTVRPDEVELDPVSAQWLADEGTFTARKNVQLLRKFAAAARRLADVRRRIELRFLRSPLGTHGAGRVEAIEVGRNEITRTRDGVVKAQAIDGAVETIECGLVLRSVGYRGVPLPDVPFDERHFVLPNERGRVIDPDGAVLPAVYAVGWIKRGPTGILGTNKRDADETITCLLEDLRSGALPPPASPDRRQLDAFLTKRELEVVTAEGWRAIDRQETEHGMKQQRPRVKLASREQLLAAAHGLAAPLGGHRKSSPLRAGSPHRW